ncbi:hypothetical protein J437_LFUL005103 [Ladona fulva]|uniref:Uncharacterized protein n=1 Tax=Ladona fulva TaxID=123851 RepID=A0A8K0NWW0_LADFU|nr:hypothetical protein J437_LFUL005103 [Ladona fulva]
MERRDIAAAVNTFLRKMHLLRTRGDEQLIIYLDETWVNQSHSWAYIWKTLMRMRDVKSQQEKGRLSKKSSDYQEEINDDEFCKYFVSMLMGPEEGSVIVMDMPLVMVRREFPYHRWEPIYIGTNREPLYSEVLSWEGQQDKMTQMHQMCLLGYHFVVLDRAFLVHTPGVKRAQPLFHGKPLKIELDAEAKVQREWMKKHEKRNTHFYEMIVESMNLAHPRNPKCKTR